MAMGVGVAGKFFCRFSVRNFENSSHGLMFFKSILGVENLWFRVGASGQWTKILVRSGGVRRRKRQQNRSRYFSNIFPSAISELKVGNQ